MLFNGTALAHVTGRSLSVVPDNNTGVIVEALWSPLASGGDAGIVAGRELLSSYVSGTELTNMLSKPVGYGC